MDSDGYKSPLHKMTCTSLTELWNDSCSIEELKYAIENGAAGATANPVIVGEVLNKEMSLWTPRIRALIEENPFATEDDIAWKVTEEMTIRGAKLLEPVFEGSNGKKGRLSIQTNPKYYRNPQLMIDQAIHFNSLAPNIIVKLPVTEAGVKAIEEATYNGLSINATVCFTVSQCLAVAEAVERGLTRREKDRKDISSIGPVCTVMVGRLDDWLKVVAGRKGIVANPECLEWAGVAVMKRAYQIFKEREYKTRLLSAATRNHMHWSEFIGGDVVVTITHEWQRRFNSSDVAVIHRIDRPVEKKIISELSEKFDDFRRAYHENGIPVAEFADFGATRRTLRQFMEGYEKLVGQIRDFMLPEPEDNII
jgi:transaldolase